MPQGRDGRLSVKTVHQRSTADGCSKGSRVAHGGRYCLQGKLTGHHPLPVLFLGVTNAEVVIPLLSGRSVRLFWDSRIFAGGR